MERRAGERRRGPGRRPSRALHHLWLAPAGGARPEPVAILPVQQDADRLRAVPADGPAIPHARQRRRRLPHRPGTQCHFAWRRPRFHHLRRRARHQPAHRPGRRVRLAVGRAGICAGGQLRAVACAAHPAAGFLAAAAVPRGGLRRLDHRRPGAPDGRDVRRRFSGVRHRQPGHARAVSVAIARRHAGQHRPAPGYAAGAVHRGAIRGHAGPDARLSSPHRQHAAQQQQHGVPGHERLCLRHARGLPDHAHAGRHRGHQRRQRHRAGQRRHPGPRLRACGTVGRRCPAPAIPAERHGRRGRNPGGRPVPAVQRRRKRPGGADGPGRCRLPVLPDANQSVHGKPSAGQPHAAGRGRDGFAARHSQQPLAIHQAAVGAIGGARRRLLSVFRGHGVGRRPAPIRLRRHGHSHADPGGSAGAPGGRRRHRAELRQRPADDASDRSAAGRAGVRIAEQAGQDPAVGPGRHEHPDGAGRHVWHGRGTAGAAKRRAAAARRRQRARGRHSAPAEPARHGRARASARTAGRVLLGRRHPAERGADRRLQSGRDGGAGRDHAHSAARLSRASHF